MLHFMGGKNIAHSAKGKKSGLLFLQDDLSLLLQLPIVVFHFLCH